jgi:hypothetical protein
MDPDRVRNQQLLCWRGSAAIYPIDHPNEHTTMDELFGMSDFQAARVESKESMRFILPRTFCFPSLRSLSLLLVYAV